MNDFEDAFREAQDAETLGHFQNLTKIVKSWSDEERERYAETNPIRIWMVAGPSEDHAIAISAN